MNALRTFSVIALLALGAVFAVSANATVWVNRTVFNTDRFVSTVNDALDDEVVQEQLATRLSTALIEQGQVEQRLTEALSEDAALLAPILTRQAQDLLYDICLRVIQSPAAEEVFDASLRVVHTQVVNILEGDSAVAFDEDQVVIDLKVILERAAVELGVDGDGLLANVELSEDAGQIVLIKDAKRAESISDLVALHDQITWLVVGLAIACFALGILISRDRRSTLGKVGILLVICGILAVTVLFPVRPIVSGLAQNPDAARPIFDAFTYLYRVQSLLLILIGFLVAMVAFLVGDSDLASAIRGSVRRQPGSTAPDLGGAIRNNAGLLRAIGLGAGALLLAAWPTPSDRFCVTTMLLIAAYFGILWIITGGSKQAEAMRTWFGKFGEPDGASLTDAGFAARNAKALRVAGVTGAILVAMVVPNLGLGAIAAIVAVTLLYLALVEWAATRTA